MSGEPKKGTRERRADLARSLDGLQDDVLRWLHEGLKHNAELPDKLKAVDTDELKLVLGRVMRKRGLPTY